MKQEAGKSKQSYYAQLLRVMLLMVVLAVLLSVGATAMTMSQYLRTQLRSVRGQLIEQSANALDAQFGAINELILNIAASPSVSMLLNADGDVLRRTQAVIDLTKLHDTAIATSSGIDTLFLYLPQINTIVSHGSTEADIYVRYRITGRADDSVAAFLEWIRGVRKLTYMSYERAGDGERKLIEVLPLPLGGQVVRGYLCATLTPGPLWTEADGGLLDPSSDGFVIANAEEVLFSHNISDEVRSSVKTLLETSLSSGDYRLADRAYQLVVRASQSGALTYAHIISKDLMQHHTRWALMLALVICLSLSCAAVIICLRLTRGLYKPVGSLINALVAGGRLAPEREAGELASIGRVVDEVLMDNRALRKVIDDLRPSIDEVEFQRVMNRRDGDGAQRWLSELLGTRLHLVALRFARQGLLSRQYAPEAMNRLLTTVGNRAREMLAQSFSLRMARDGGDLCALLAHDLEPDDFRETIARLLQEMQEYALEQFGLTLLCAVSDCALRPGEAAQMADALRSLATQCRAAFEQAYLSNLLAGCIWYRETASDLPSTMLLLPTIDTEREIVNRLLNGEDAAWHVARTMVDMNLCDGSVSYTGMRKLLGDLLDIAFKAAVAGGEEPEALLGDHEQARREMLACDTVQEATQYLEGLYESARVFYARRDASLPLQRADLDDYIKAHWREDIGQNDAAAHWALSNAYFAKLCRMLTGESFSDYLNRTRIGKAQQLIALNTISITEIAAQSGYNNYKTFARYFKKFTALSPSEYKDILRTR